MKRLLAMLALIAGLTLAACGGTGGSPDTSVEPFSPEASPSVETSPESSGSPEMSPSASPS